jgi:type IV pilus assembly protein PilB
MGVEPYNFVSALNCILAQRLVRLICESCKKAVPLTREMMEESALDAKQWSGLPVYEGTGCLECSGSGFRGRTAIHEILDLSDRIREMIIDRRPTSEIKKVAQEEGMTFLREAGLDKVRAGETTLREINKVTFIG